VAVLARENRSRSQDMKSMIRKIVIATLGLLASVSAAADWALNMPKGVTELSAETYNLHMMVFWVCVAIGVLVFGVMIVSLVKHRKSRGAVPAKFSHSTMAEVIWTALPVVILLVMAIPAAETMVRLEDARKADMTIVATGYQWKWHYRYQNEEVDFYSSLARPSLEARQKDAGIDPFSVDNYLLDVDRPLVVPVGAKVRLLTTSNDGIPVSTSPAGATLAGIILNLCSDWNAVTGQVMPALRLFSVCV